MKFSTSLSRGAFHSMETWDKWQPNKPLGLSMVTLSHAWIQLTIDLMWSGLWSTASWDVLWKTITQVTFAVSYLNFYQVTTIKSLKCCIGDKCQWDYNSDQQSAMLSLQISESIWIAWLMCNCSYQLNISFFLLWTTENVLHFV